VDTGLSNVTLTQVASSYGTKYFTLAFVDGAGCQWSMPNSSGWQQQVNDLRAAGGDVIISFGGWGSDNGGTDLGATCSSPDAMAAQIENVVTTFNATRLDFDIEAAAITNATDVDRTTKALAQVRSWRSGLALDYTIPTFPTGLSDDGVNLLNTSKANGFTPDVVNVMSMDYGSSGTEMGDAANSAVDAAAGQVASAFGKSGAEATAMMGNTPMIGQNDSAGEVFTTADAASVVSHASSRGIAMVSFWSEGRDNGGCAGSATASSTCSGVSQGDGDFTKAFQKF
jgi:chitinase